MKEKPAMHTLFRFILTQSLVVAAALSLVGLLFYTLYYQDTRRRFNEDTAAELQRVSAYMDGWFSYFDYAVSSLVTAQNFREAVESGSHSEISERIRSIRGEYAILEEVLFYPVDAPLVYTSRGTVDRETFFGQFYQYPPGFFTAHLAPETASLYTGAQGLQDVFRLSVENRHRISRLFIPSCELQTSSISRTDILMLVYAVDLSYEGKGSLAFCISSRAITAMLEGVGGEYAGWQLLTAAGDRLLSGGAEAGVSAQTVLDTAAYAPTGITQDDFTVIACNSGQAPTVLAVTIPRRAYFAASLPVLLVATLAVIVVLLVAFGAVALFTRRNYRPIARLIRKAADIAHVEGGGRDDLALLERSLDTIEPILESSERLKSQLNAQAGIVRQQYFSRLIAGDFGNTDEIFREAEACGVSFPEEAFILLVFKENKAAQARVDFSFIADALARSAENGAAGWWIFEPVFEDGFVLLANGTPDGCAWLASTVSRALREYAQRTDAAMRFIRSAGAGRQGTAAEIRRMYYEAFTAADLADGMQDGLVFFEHLSSLQNQPFSGTPADYSLLAQCVRQGDAQEAARQFDDLWETITRGNSSVILAKYICTEILNAVQEKDTPIDYASLARFKAMLGVSSPEENREQLRQLLLSLCERNRSALLSDADRMVAYIDAHFTDPQLSLAQLSEIFGLSVYYISRMVKKKTGVGFAQYVAALRMARVTELLRDSDLPIKDIVLAVGYGDVPSFLRKFKQIQGVTMGDYRERYR